MYSSLYQPIPDISAYLRRLGLEGASLSPDRGSLDRLIFAHLTHIPFENLDVFELDECPELGIPQLFDKIITRRRGGFCFELNALFFQLLRDLGFEVYPVICRVLLGKSFFPPPTHRATIAVIDGQKYFCDVGYGGPASAFCLCYDGAPSPDGFSLSVEGDTVCTRRLKDGVYETIIAYRDIPVDQVDFVPLAFHQAKSPASYFRTKRMANLRTADGSISIDGDVFRRHSAKGVTETALATREEYLDTLKTYFGIDFS